MIYYVSINMTQCSLILCQAFRSYDYYKVAMSFWNVIIFGPSQSLEDRNESLVWRQIGSFLLRAESSLCHDDGQLIVHPIR